MILNNGMYNGIQILWPSTVDLIFHNFNTVFPEDTHGLWFKLGQFPAAGAMHSLQTAGHTGFTGTSMVMDRCEYYGLCMPWAELILMKRATRSSSY